MRAAAVITSLCCSACFSKPPAPAAGRDASNDGSTDGARDGTADARATCASPGPWGSLMAIGVNTTDHEQGPWLSPEGLDLYFSRATQTGTVKGVFRAHRASTSSSWGSPTQVVLGTSIVGNQEDADVWLSDDQMRIYWAQQQAYIDIYFASRTSITEPFPDGVMLVQADAAQIDTYSAALTSDENTIVYVQTLHSGPTDTVYIATRSSPLDSFAPSLVTGINQANNITSPTLTEDKLTLFWADTDSTLGASRIFTATRTSTATTAFASPTEVENQPTNMMMDIKDPFISHDGTTLVFAMQNIGDSNGYDLYQMTRTCN